MLEAGEVTTKGRYDVLIDEHIGFNEMAKLS